LESSNERREFACIDLTSSSCEMRPLNFKGRSHFSISFKFFIIIINVGVQVSLRAPQLISQVLKLTTM